MLNIAQMRLADTKPLGQLVLIKLTNTAQQLDIAADTRQAAFIVPTSPQPSQH